MSTFRTVTLNTGFDETYHVTGLQWGEVERVLSYQSVPSGKGVSAARTAAALALPVCVYALIGEPDAATYRAALQRERLPHRLVTVPGSTRRNLTVMTDKAVAAHMVAPGFTLSDDHAVWELAELLVADCQPGDLVSFNGSVPQGVAPSIWAEIAQRLADRGVELAVDVQGEAMRNVLQSADVLFAKPNEMEIAALSGTMSVRESLAALAAYGVQYPLVTLGGAGVAYLVAGHVFQAVCPVERPVVAVAAGDAFFAGAVAAVLGGEREATAVVASGAACAAAHVSGLAGYELAMAYSDNLARVSLQHFRP